MGRLIDADEYEKRIKPYNTEDIIDKALYNFAHEKLITTPTAQKVGKWIFNPRDGIEAMFTKPKCSICGFESADGLNYCSNCGADMREVENETD